MKCLKIKNLCLSLCTKRGFYFLSPGKIFSFYFDSIICLRNNVTSSLFMHLIRLPQMCEIVLENNINASINYANHKIFLFFSFLAIEQIFQVVKSCQNFHYKCEIICSWFAFPFLLVSYCQMRKLPVILLDVQVNNHQPCSKTYYFLRGFFLMNTIKFF